jgi:hypothetical protein
MKLKALGCQAILAALLAIGASGTALAQADCKTLIQPSPFSRSPSFRKTDKWRKRLRQAV